MKVKNTLIWLLLLLALAVWLASYLGMGRPELSTAPALDESDLPTKLHPAVKEKKDKLISLAAKRNIEMVVTDDFRSVEEQNELYEKGRSAPGNIVTHVKGGESFHNFGLAFDYAIKNKAGQVIWDINYDGNGNDKSDWFEVAALAKQMGFRWGGDWERFKDYPHLEMTFGLTINDLLRGERPEEA
ncbi:M15 family metallopeptidase [Peribacillus sp. SCS-26]|uniref:M15 family metallopeptidase n=1 Tax=Paraperibacillus marinus TaxID=3115295 RepID=UPI003905C769